MTRTVLVYSTTQYKNYPKPLVYEPKHIVSACGKFLTAVWEDAQRKQAAKRLIIDRNGYVYTPSNEWQKQADEWKDRFIRFKNIVK